MHNSTLAVLLLSTIAFHRTAEAQPTLVSALVDQSGVQLDLYLVTSPGSATEPSDGANQTWDLSSISLQPIGSLDFTQAGGTPYAMTYPSANWAWAQTITGVGTDYTYVTIDINVLELVATGVPADVNNYIDPKRLLSFPMDFGQSQTDSYEDSDGPGTATWTYSGHGTAITPLGIFGGLAKVGSSEGDIILWNTSPLHPAMIDDGSTILVFAPGDVGLSERGALFVQTYPNPCGQDLFVEAYAADWRITDLAGRTMLGGRFHGPALQRVDVSTLVPGAYILVLDQDGQRRTVRFSKA